ncbi:LysR family transcriptional regulator [Sphingomonas nostoxanthinifaciens]|uniref:LysR family transcriptional regulator n=1 Tax=Sphingomonas nostoxanthinifaciens TaxID=2872652 RepID=UPI001CC1E81C|nr:LysR family transcriptional regulator [Sphingomonas nostoxanthinifaciens]UAK23187.1 LysR family transcriptional regulator [Sphingomonas nostoxanthinifaciens]
MRIDLNLLVVFEAVLRERSVTRAGARLGLSQPAMSHALNRLRHLTKDQLFVRSSEGMIPTPLAERLAEPVRRSLLDLRTALEAEEFVPEDARQRFIIAVNNYAAVALVAPIIQRARALAPNLQFRFRPSGTLDVADMLDRGELDLALVAHTPRLSRFHSHKLLEDEFVGVVRRGHPILKTELDLATFAGLPQLAISSSGDDLSFIEDLLDAAGLTRTTQFEVPYLAAGAVLTQSDMIAIVARHVAEEFRRAYSVQIVDLPFASKPCMSVMVWQGRFEDQAAHRWMRQSIISVADEISR